MSTRATMLFQLTTTSSSSVPSPARTGGWSESFWFNADIPLDHEPWRNIIQQRATMLPLNATIVGQRLSKYTLLGNRIIPGGAQAQALNFTGSSRLQTDIPQMTLQFDGTAVGKVNRNRVNCAGIPDAEVTQGEFRPAATFLRVCTLFADSVIAGSAGFLGRDQTKQSSKIASIVAGVMTLDNALPGVAVGTYIRINRVTTTNNLPFSGSFRVGAVAGAVYTMQGMDDINAERSGTAMEDAVVICQYASLVPKQIRTRKIGRPSRGYRGRSSRRRAA